MRNTATNRRNIVLVGPMGSGKSHVGRLLAARLGLAFVDVDARIEADAGMPIPAIFAGEGEAGFRERERVALADVLAQDAQVIATGGGAVLADANRAAMRDGARVVYLQVDRDTQLARLAGDTARPLLQGQDHAQRLAQLQAQREPLYRSTAHFTLDASKLAPEQAAEAIEQLLASTEVSPA